MGGNAQAGILAAVLIAPDSWRKKTRSHQQTPQKSRSGKLRGELAESVPGANRPSPQQSSSGDVPIALILAPIPSPAAGPLAGPPHEAVSSRQPESRGCSFRVLVFPCYTEIVLRNVTVTLPEEVARWAKVRAAEQNMSLSRLIAALLESEMRQSGAYKKAYKRWKALDNVAGIDAERRLSREQAHERGR